MYSHINWFIFASTITSSQMILSGVFVNLSPCDDLREGATQRWWRVWRGSRPRYHRNDGTTDQTFPRHNPTAATETSWGTDTCLDILHSIKHNRLWVSVILTKSGSVLLLIWTRGTKSPSTTEKNSMHGLMDIAFAFIKQQHSAK